MKRDKTKLEHLVRFYHLIIEYMIETSSDAECIKQWTIIKNEQICTLRITCQSDDKHEGRPVDLTIKLPIERIPDDYRIDDDGTVEWNLSAMLQASGFIEKFLTSTPEKCPYMTYSRLEG